MISQIKNDELSQVLIEIEAVCQPTSIFLYGSRARHDAVEQSDYEVGVLLSADNYVSRSVLRGAVKRKNISVYPFHLEEFIKMNPDTPFNKNIYMRELITSGKTLKGEEIIENLIPPEVTNIDLLSEAQFNLGYALAATVAHRDGNVALATMLFYKSCLFGTRALISLKEKQLPLTYDHIVDQAKKMNLGEYELVVQNALTARTTGVCESVVLYKNISYLNQVVVPQIRSHIEDNGVTTIITR